MSRPILHITLILLLFLMVHPGWAQISPGELAKSHSSLEGISNCTQCHTLGDKVSNDKCLACHKEIKSRIAQNKGYHSSKDIKGKSCASCHNDHHGKNFDMIHFNPDQFDHKLSKYELTGAHSKVDCRSCHKSEWIKDAELKKRKGTYLGTGTSCKDCHADVHRGTLSKECTQCHTTEAFEPASKFNHNNVDFTLKGKHKSTDCKACHPIETREGKKFQKFKGIEFQNCSSCHEDAHRNNLGPNCRECHTEESFQSHALLTQFNHSQTPFALKGKHKQVDCAKCHNLNVAATSIFQEKKGIVTSNCKSCHEDVHKGKFGNNCAECHQESSFKTLKNMDNFNHGLTSYPLQGKHIAVDCKACHSEDYTVPVPHNTCASCHKDYHEGQFVRSTGAAVDCAVCHTVNGFKESTYTIAQHALSKFPLTGAHQATPCFACHLKQEKWLFRNLKMNCVDCHENIHKSEIDVKYYPNQTCSACHLTTDWKSSSFDHSKRV
ncbi:cytochrome c family protein [Haliscomenobacter sp.]|uniref:cytochrome c3 family protein n=1 Tax=Haliscomenobacter sp. TaxID=2717303 RepID=UPI0035933F76